MDKLIKDLLMQNNTPTEVYNIIITKYHTMFYQELQYNIFIDVLILIACIAVFSVLMYRIIRYFVNDETPILILANIIVGAILIVDVGFLSAHAVSPNTNLMQRINNQKVEIQKEKFTAETGIVLENK